MVLRADKPYQSPPKTPPENSTGRQTYIHLTILFPLPRIIARLPRLPLIRMIPHPPVLLVLVIQVLPIASFLQDPVTVLRMVRGSLPILTPIKLLRTMPLIDIRIVDVRIFRDVNVIYVIIVITKITPPTISITQKPTFKRPSKFPPNSTK